MEAQVEPQLWVHTGPWPVESRCQAGQREWWGLWTAPTGRSVVLVLGAGEGRVVGGTQRGQRELPCHPAYPPPCPSTVVVSIREVLIV